ncbi:MAG TPA: zinc-ribbon domain-containing protein, partial [Perlabentimonas sp.]|nr:zinc-ribbon domain-containing protein [Perlabentimonas sp.]
MIQCPHCGVELEKNANFCSLCGEPLIDEYTDNLVYLKSRKILQQEKQRADYHKLTELQKRKISWKISGAILIPGIILTLVINLVGNQATLWSKYPVTVGLVLFINITLYTFLHRRGLLFAMLSYLSVAALLFLLDIYASESNFDLKWGLAMLLAAYVTIIALIYKVRRLKQKGLNIIAYSILAAGLLCVYTDGIISLYSCGSLQFKWSLIVIVSALFASVALFYIHYR